MFHQAARVDADAVSGAGLLDSGDLGVLQVERFPPHLVTDLDRLADFVEVVGVQQDAVSPDFQRLVGRSCVLSGPDTGDEVRLLADPGDEVFERNDLPVLADDDSEVGFGGDRLGEGLVVLVEDADVAAVGGGPVLPERREVRGAGEIRREVDRAVALTVFADDGRIGPESSASASMTWTSPLVNAAMFISPSSETRSTSSSSTSTQSTPASIPAVIRRFRVSQSPTSLSALSQTLRVIRPRPQRRGLNVAEPGSVCRMPDKQGRNVIWLR